MNYVILYQVPVSLFFFFFFFFFWYVVNLDSSHGSKSIDLFVFIPSYKKNVHISETLLVAIIVVVITKTLLLLLQAWLWKLRKFIREHNFYETQIVQI
jgi:uncharacterized membrane protein YozB (DUF420 family)